MNWYLLAIVSVVFYTAQGLLQRRISVSAKFPRAMSFAFNVYGALIAIVMFLLLQGYKNITLPKTIFPWFLMVFAFAMYAMYERGRFLAAKLLDASVLAIISNLGLVVAFIGSLFLYSETLSLAKIIGTGLIVLSLVLIGVNGKVKKVSLKGILVAVTIYTFLGVGWMLDKRGGLFFTPNVYQLFGWIIPNFFIYLPYIRNKEIFYEAKRSGWKVGLLALFNVIGYYLQLVALTLGQAVVVIPLVQLSTLSIVISGIFLLKEKENILRKVTASLIGLLGAILLAGAF